MMTMTMAMTMTMTMMMLHPDYPGPPANVLASAAQEDGFLLWRVEMGFLLAGILLGEGLSLLDLTAAPGWPGTWNMLRGQTVRAHVREVREESGLIRNGLIGRCWK